MTPGRNGSRRRDRPKSEFDHQLVEVKRVARVVKGGRRFRFRATVVIGDRKGRVAAGMAKGADVSIAVDKATKIAKKNLITVPMHRKSIPHEVEIKFGSAKLFLRPAPLGAGVIAGGPVRAVVELAGIRNIYSKIYGSRNKTNNVIATIEALKTLRSVEQIASSRKKDLKSLGIKLEKEKTLGGKKKTPKAEKSK